jgi:hypothetical protein
MCQLKHALDTVCSDAIINYTNGMAVIILTGLMKEYYTAVRTSTKW